MSGVKRMGVVITKDEKPEEFDADAFLETLSEQHPPPKEPPYRNPSPPTTPPFYQCPLHPEEALEERHPVGTMGVEQASLPRLLRVLWDPLSDPHPRSKRQHAILLRLGPTSTPRLLSPTPSRQDEMFLRQTFDHDHVTFQEKSRLALPQMFQAFMRFLPMGRWSP